MSKMSTFPEFFVSHASTLDEASREPDGNMCADNPILQNPERRNSVVAPYTSRIRSSDECTLSPSTKDEIMALGYPSNGGIFEGYSFINSFDFDYGVSRWVTECLTREQVKKVCVSRKNASNSFYEDEEIDVERRVTLDDYKNSDYQKGHLAAAGNHRYSFQAYERTFCLRNIAPMYENTNFILSKIEKQAQRLAKDKGKVHIITGPVFHDAKKEPIFVKEGSKVRVPDAFFKVLVHDDTHKKRNIHRVFAYIVENKNDDDDEDIKKALKDIKNARLVIHLWCGFILEMRELITTVTLDSTSVAMYISISGCFSEFDDEQLPRQALGLADQSNK
ncbi:Endonuclease G, mitochondrial [Araneus ventricosus]|uniref:Endonuclease G, mitochondrial n=1 Tax=Araneus ventricosus TaxID=182803 RepID=A0A4Y2IAX3_ARAVE|nr:Endonuclease G, mitochondrial [Araneus ventricosus]